jgi:hypothetical protein
MIAVPFPEVADVLGQLVILPKRKAPVRIGQPAPHDFRLFNAGDQFGLGHVL